jgi:putative glutamine amidotransferase
MSDLVESPVIGLPSDVKQIGPHNFHCVGEKYISAVVDAMDGFPLLIPSLGKKLKTEQLLSQLDGLLLTGGYANIEPLHYSNEEPYEGCMLDPDRDATTLSLIPAAIAQGVPILGICRGLQELNVAMGGSLFQKVQDEDGFFDHREDTTQTLDVQYGAAHEIFPESGGILFEITNGKSVNVNSLHGQGIKQLGENLIVECKAPDGLVEGVSYIDKEHFVLAVQWHPEWKVTENPFYLAIFERFKEACMKRAAQRHNGAQQ